MYKKGAGDTVLYVLVYVDDILILSPSTVCMESFIMQVTAKYDIRSERTVEKFLGIQIKTFSDGSVKLHASLEIQRIIREFDMIDCRPASTALPNSVNIMKGAGNNKDDQIDSTRYQELMDSLLFVANTCRPDISFSVGLLSRFMSASFKTHWSSAMHLLRYLSGTTDYGICFHASDENNFLSAFSDADFAGCRDSRKSTSGSVFIFSGGAISWSSKKQPIVVQSTVEAEFVALSFAVREAIWLRQLCFDTDVSIGEAVTIGVDNQGCIAISEQDRLSERSKHIDLKFHFVKDHVKEGTIVLEYIPTDLMAADILTKPLTKHKHEANLRLIGL